MVGKQENFTPTRKPNFNVKSYSGSLKVMHLGFTENPTANHV